MASTGEPGSPGTPKHASKAGRSIALVAATATVSIALTSLVWWNVLQGREHYWQTLKSPLAGNNFLEVADGVDPMQTECREDKVVADIGTRLEDTVQVEMLYSNSCMGVWGRVTLLNGQPEGSVLAMRIYPADDPLSSRSQERTAENVNSLYTPLLIEPDVEARVCGIATLTVDDEVTELGPAMCI
ncbi:DUF2690 domain-containing protein [Leucobacter albus]|uniref:DUF2690 domain-containing protein n=1 Tax=Leucobacter albus TaxID=272210 RepID=A0ABW3TQ00_9MICO